MSLTQLGSDILGSGSVVDMANFGINVACSQDGNVIAVAGSGYDTSAFLLNTGHVRVYEFTNGNWVQRGIDLVGSVSNEYFGGSVSLSSDGSVLAVSSPNITKIYLYTWNGIQYELKNTKTEATISSYGTVVKLTPDGSTIIVGAPYSSGSTGVVFVYTIDSNYTFQQKGATLVSPSTTGVYGNSVTISSDGNTIAVGAKFIHSVYVYTWNSTTGTWDSHISNPLRPDNSGNFGIVTMDEPGTTLVVGAPGYSSSRGAIYTYKLESNIWTLKNRFISTGPTAGYFGSACSISSDGQRLAVGAYGENKTYIYTWNSSTNTWSLLGSALTGTKESFGMSIALSSTGTFIIVGAQTNAINGLDSGRVYMYSYTTNWFLQGTPISGLGSFNRTTRSGKSFDISSDGSILVIGEPEYDISGMQAAGAIRTFLYTATGWAEQGILLGPPSVGLFGTHVVISADGQTIAVSANSNRVYVYSWDLTQSVWVANTPSYIISAGINTGTITSLNREGTLLAIGATMYDLPVYLYKKNSVSGIWELKTSVSVSGTNLQFGISLSLSNDSSTLAVGILSTTQNGNVNVYNILVDSSGTYSLQLKGTQLAGSPTGTIENYGAAVSLNENGTRLAVGANNASKVYLYEWNGTQWFQMTNSPIAGPSASNFGISVAINSSGSVLAVGAPARRISSYTSGSAYLYLWSNSAWQTNSSVGIDGLPMNEQFGSVVQVSGNGSRVGISAPNSSLNGPASGRTAVYQYAYTPTAPYAPDVDIYSIQQTSITIQADTYDDGNSPILNYKYSINGGPYIAFEPPQISGTLTFTDLTPGQTYTIGLKAVNAIGESTASTTSATLISVPDAPTGLTANPQDSALVIGFTAGGDGGSAILDYQYSLDTSNIWISIGVTVLSFLVSGLVNGSPTTVHLRAVNAVGYGNSASITGTPATVPGIPTGITATPQDGALSIGFTAGSNGGSAILDYQYSLDTTTWVSVGISTNPFIVSGLPNGSSTTVYLRAVNEIGNGSYGNVSGTPVSSSQEVVCIVSGQRVLTPSGYKLIDILQDGDLIVTATGKKVPIRMYKTIIGETTVRTAPMRVSGPNGDVLLSPLHAYKVNANGWMMPRYAVGAGYTNVKQERLGYTVTYYHIETPNYLQDDLVLEGMIVESYGMNFARQHNINPKTVYLKSRMGNWYERIKVSTHAKSVKK
jgi:hypothetical protein